MSNMRVVKAGILAAACGLLAACAGPSGQAAHAPQQRRIHYALYTHCGIDEARIGSAYYLADHPLSDGQGNPPPGWGNPYQHGTMSTPTPGVAVFRDRLGHVVRFHARAHATSYLRICS